MSSPNHIEVEIKLPLADPDRMRECLTGLGIERRSERMLEQNVLLDSPDASLRGSGRLLRLRRFGDRAVITFKGAGVPGKHKMREELETGIEDPDLMQSILARLGYEPSFRYEKYRTEFSDGTGHVTLDETPIGNFVELEGPAEWIDTMASRLGYEEGDYITKSYGKLYMEFCAARGEQVSDMLFAAKE
jgi:adenylate cyclase, class 2